MYSLNNDTVQLRAEKHITTFLTQRINHVVFPEDEENFIFS